MEQLYTGYFLISSLWSYEVGYIFFIYVWETKAQVN